MRAGKTHLAITIAALNVCIVGTNHAVADDLIYRYEGDVFPDEAGWQIFNPCVAPCSESVVDSRFVSFWPTPNDRTNYHFDIAIEPKTMPPPTLWVEWRFRSNHPIGRNFTACDAHFTVDFREVHEFIDLYGDAAISADLSGFALHLALNEFHTFRFESLDGERYWFSVDGDIFLDRVDQEGNFRHFLQFGGSGGCIGDWIPNMVNEWDFIRCGTIAAGEQLETAAPSPGFLDARQHAGIDRILAVFQEPNYVYPDEISIDVTDLAGLNVVSGPLVAPTAEMTRRREPPDPLDVEDDPRIVEIVLDRPLPYNATTRITLDDGVAVSAIEYTFALGDANGTGGVDLADVAYLQNCVGGISANGVCGVFDFNRNGVMEIWEFLSELTLITTPTASASREDQEN